MLLLNIINYICKSINFKRKKMAKNQIELNSELMERIRPLAVKNGIVPTNQNLVDLAVKVTVDMIESLDSQDFQQISNLKN